MYKLLLSSIISIIFASSIFLFYNQSWSKTRFIPLGVSPIIATDYIHSVIEADRTIYSKMIVERLGETISLKAEENWLEKKHPASSRPVPFIGLGKRQVPEIGNELPAYEFVAH